MMLRAIGPMLGCLQQQAGLVVAVVILVLWMVSLTGLFAVDVTRVPISVIVLGVLLRTFLHTGLFIVTHEAIHGLIAKNRRTNGLMGQFASFLYAFLHYKSLVRKHRLHHLYAATSRDPDFCTLHSENFLRWYVKFMQRYQEGNQAWISVIGMTFTFCILASVPVARLNIFLFWLVPLILSSLQLFTFGIFLPHRQVGEGDHDRHRTKSVNYSVFWSFITCYHFGYHLEHHRYPNLPWYKLPQAHQKST
ncbi:MAG: fatty acid desaturase [Cyanobacteria bacterium J06638_28]